MWVETAQTEAWTCAACAWAFLPSGPPQGDTLEEMIQNYERQRDIEFISHACAQHPVHDAVSDHSSFSRQKKIENTKRTVVQAMAAKE